ncbi:hypothetical protein ACTVZO_17670 [Streptomyces sp. IBSNAI002]|uniref:hypothetical protein n=1 Tax=Streptomyces sp. IBSNAI002 TaxID=3457500 RepID=UPI003FD07E62
MAAETFGHEPVLGIIGGRALWTDCARCHTTTTHYDEAYRPSRWTRPVPWPCTTAIVLGLVQRPTTDQPAP